MAGRATGEQAASDGAARRQDAYTGMVTLAATAFIVAILYFAQEILLPIALSTLLSFLLAPLVTRLERWKLGRIPAVMVAVALACAVIGGTGWIVTRQLLDLTTQLPKYEDTLLEKARTLREATGGRSKVSKAVEELRKELTDDVPPDVPAPSNRTATAPAPAPDLAPDLVPMPVPVPDAEPEPPTVTATLHRRTVEPIPVRVVETSPLPLVVLRDWLGPLLAPLGTAAIVMLFVIFMLIKREDLRDRVIRLAGVGRVYLTTQAIDDAAARVSRFLLMQFIVNSTYGVAVAVGLFFIGVPNAFLWGLLATVLRFVPYIGPWVAAILPTALAIAVFPGWTAAFLTVGWFVVLELLSNNVMEPWLYGHSTGISVVGIIVSAVFWTWLWGPVGLVLSTPLTVCLTVLGRHVPRLNFLNVLLSDEPALELNVRFYQRLLAFDDHEAVELATDFLKTATLDELYEQMLIPALSFAERDRHADHLSRAQQRFIHRTVRDLIGELGEEFNMSAAAEAVPEGAAEADAAERPEFEGRTALRILCVPAMDRADRLAGLMLVQLLQARGHQVEAVPTRATDNYLPHLVTEKQAEWVIISALAPGGAAQAREGLRRLRPRHGNLKFVIGLWNARGPLTKTKARLEAAGADLVTTSLTEALETIRHFAEPVADKAPAAR